MICISPLKTLRGINKEIGETNEDIDSKNEPYDNNTSNEKLEISIEKIEKQIERTNITEYLNETDRVSKRQKSSWKTKRSLKLNFYQN